MTVYCLSLPCLFYWISRLLTLAATRGGTECKCQMATGRGFSSSKHLELRAKKLTSEKSCSGDATWFGMLTLGWLFLLNFMGWLFSRKTFKVKLTYVYSNEREILLPPCTTTRRVLDTKWSWYLLQEFYGIIKMSKTDSDDWDFLIGCNAIYIYAQIFKINEFYLTIAKFSFQFSVLIVFYSFLSI